MQVNDPDWEQEDGDVYTYKPSKNKSGRMLVSIWGDEISIAAYGRSITTLPRGTPLDAALFKAMLIWRQLYDPEWGGTPPTN